jgi:hypothetical protein
MTRANFFSAITGAIAAAIPGKSETAFKECPECAAKPGSPILCEDCLRRRDGNSSNLPPAKIEEFSAKGKLFVIELPIHLSEQGRHDAHSSLKHFEEQLGCRFMLVPPGYKIYDPTVAPNEAMVERIAERVAEKIRPEDEFPVRTSAGLLCECGYEMWAVGETFPTPPRRLFECRNPNCRRHGMKVWEPMHAGRTATGEYTPPTTTYNIDARGADPEGIESRVERAIINAHRSAIQTAIQAKHNLPPLS